MSGNNAGEPLEPIPCFGNWNTTAAGLQCFLFFHNTVLLEAMFGNHFQIFIGSNSLLFFAVVCSKNILTRSMWNMPPSHHYVLIFFLGNASGRFLASHVRLVNLRYLISGKTLEKEHGLRIVHVN
jgi:hypothetical protein